MILTFGEVMLRIGPEGMLRFRQCLPGRVEASFGGGESNVACSLALLGDRVRYLTALPGNDIADALAGFLRGLGVDTGCILRRAEGRVGIYFLEGGANQRGSKVTYDRAMSAVALAAPEEYDFERALSDVSWVHVTGITPALSDNAFRSTLRLAELARGRGATVSCDLNFRKKLWRWEKGVAPGALAGRCMSKILEVTDVAIANEEDAADVLGIHAEGTSVESGRINAPAYRAVAEAMAARFPGLALVGVTLRESVSATHNNWGAMLYDARGKRAHFAPCDGRGDYRPYEIRSIVDRVGAGDSFAAGLIHVLCRGQAASPADAVRFAAAASCLKHSIPGDVNFASEDEVIALLKGDASGRVKR
jgi:2-dehydro-3-deoxygluconokinase